MRETRPRTRSRESRNLGSTVKPIPDSLYCNETVYRFNPTPLLTLQIRSTDLERPHIVIDDVFD